MGPPERGRSADPTSLIGFAGFPLAAALDRRAGRHRLRDSATAGLRHRMAVAAVVAATHGPRLGIGQREPQAPGTGRRGLGLGRVAIAPAEVVVTVVVVAQPEEPDQPDDQRADVEYAQPDHEDPSLQRHGTVQANSLANQVKTEARPRSNGGRWRGAAGGPDARPPPTTRPPPPPRGRTSARPRSRPPGAPAHPPPTERESPASARRGTATAGRRGRGARRPRPAPPRAPRGPRPPRATRPARRTRPASSSGPGATRPGGRAARDRGRR